MTPRPDFVIRSPDDRTLLIVEAKTRVNASAEWAAQLRRNLVVNGVLPPAPYFLLALPDKFFLWKHQESRHAVLPDYEFDAEEVLRPYAASLGFPLDSLSGASFEWVVRLWLDDLVRGDGLEQPRWLRVSGLDEQLKDAVVSAQAA